MKYITPDELEYFRSRYRGPNEEATLQYALRTADEYAERYAPNALPSIKNAIAQLHFRHVLQGDPGEKRLIRSAIDACIEMGRVIYETTQS